MPSRPCGDSAPASRSAARRPERRAQLADAIAQADKEAHAIETGEAPEAADGGAEGRAGSSESTDARRDRQGARPLRHAADRGAARGLRRGEGEARRAAGVVEAALGPGAREGQRRPAREGRRGGDRRGDPSRRGPREDEDEGSASRSSRGIGQGAVVPSTGRMPPYAVIPRSGAQRATRDPARHARMAIEFGIPHFARDARHDCSAARTSAQKADGSLRAVGRRFQFARAGQTISP